MHLIGGEHQTEENVHLIHEQKFEIRCMCVLYVKEYIIAQDSRRCARESKKPKEERKKSNRRFI